MNATKLIGHFAVQIPVRERIPDLERIGLSSRGARFRITGHIAGIAEVSINMGVLQQLIAKAAGNKGLKARSGPCDVKVCKA